VKLLSKNCKDKVNLLSWQKGGRVPKEVMDEWLSKADALFSIGNIRINAGSAWLKHLI
jgi:hypothetical protein